MPLKRFLALAVPGVLLGVFSLGFVFALGMIAASALTGIR